MSTPTFHELSGVDIDGNTLDFGKFKNKVVYVTNVASAWGKTRRHYTQLQELQEHYNDDGLEIIGFPCNQFGRQEPKSNSDIKAFTRDKYKVNFQLMSKSDVNGDNTNEVYSWLKQRAGDTSDIGWNFARIYLVDRSGTKVQQFEGKNPSDLIGNIEELLAENEL